MELKLKQSQRLSMNLAMRQAFMVLKMPLMELQGWVDQQIEENPLLERVERGARLELCEVEQRVGLYEHLMRQVALHDFSPKERGMAEEIIGNLDEKGFYTQELKPGRERVLRIIQQFDPPGIAARSLKECLELQLEAKGVKGELETLSKEQLKGLTLAPAAPFDHRSSAMVLPDIVVVGSLVEVSDEGIPEFCLSPLIDTYVEADPSYVRAQVAAGKWLARILARRSSTLKRLAEHLVMESPEYFSAMSERAPTFTLKELADALELSPSTVARAMKEKTIACAHGVVPLSHFLKRSKNAKDLLKQLINRESKERPFSDQALAELMGKEGVLLSRRTVAKYRSALSIPAAYQRRI